MNNTRTKYRVVVAIPCRNELDYIEACVRSILENQIAHEQLYIAVVDGMSTDGTRDKILELSKKHTCVHLIDNPAKITPVAMNLGIEAADSEYVMIMGAHSTIEPDYIAKCISLLAENTALGGAGGTIENSYFDAKSALIGMAMSSSFGVGNAHFRTGNFEGEVDTIGTPVYRRSVLIRTGLFDESLVRNQDDELNHRIRKVGFKLWLTNKVRFHYIVRASWKKLFKQYRQYGYWKVYVNRKHKTVTTFRQLVPAGFVVFLLLAPIICAFIPVLWWGYLSILMLWILAANIVAFKKTSIKKVPALVWTFFLLHFSYGLGYLEGIFHFLILQRKPASKNAQLSR